MLYILYQGWVEFEIQEDLLDVARGDSKALQFLKSGMQSKNNFSRGTSIA